MRKRELERDLAIVREQRDDAMRETNRSPSVSWDILEAALAVVLILEQHAEVMSTDVGAGVAAYQRAMQRAGDLRRAIMTALGDGERVAQMPQELLAEHAQVLYEELTS